MVFCLLVFTFSKKGTLKKDTLIYCSKDTRRKTSFRVFKPRASGFDAKMIGRSTESDVGRGH